MDSLKDEIIDEKLSNFTIYFDADHGAIEFKDEDKVIMHYELPYIDIFDLAQDTSYYLLSQLRKKCHNQYTDEFLKRSDAQKFIDEMI